MSGEDPKSDYYAKKAMLLGWAQPGMAQFYARAVAEDDGERVEIGVDFATARG